MARLAAIKKNEKRRKLAAKYKVHRDQLRDMVSDPSLSPEDRFEAGIRLQKLRRDTSRVRVRNRCELTGRSRGNLRKFGLSRMKTRELANLGLLPGVTKASW
jgi:small subunit ribosomal protein S14